jgi:hypothetical protein
VADLSNHVPKIGAEEGASPNPLTAVRGCLAPPARRDLVHLPQHLRHIVVRLHGELALGPAPEGLREANRDPGEVPEEPLASVWRVTRSVRAAAVTERPNGSR